VTREIDARTLQEWLAQKKPVTVLDIRQAHDRQQWWIPESIHVDAYESLKAGDPEPLENLSLAKDRPVVTVCGSGRVSLKAAGILTEKRGLPAFSLRGGMKAWSSAWNTATQSFGPVEITQVRRTGKGCLSYLIRSGAEAAVIDPSVDPEVYLSLAEENESRLRYVLDTHVHADHLSRARILAERSGAELVLPSQNRVRFPHKSVTEGDTLSLGTASIAVLFTPGHTGESSTYLIREVGMFTGDTLFLAGVGRPDLHAGGEEVEQRARSLFASLKRLTSVDARLLVFPGHTSEPVPFDRAMLAASVGEISMRLADWLSSEQGFVHRILKRIPETPPNYLEISRMNETGEWPESDPMDLEAGANRCAVT
jgi:glyoxylase-like metal-dependent hydrolase (beta-lactamase superfamily II)/rhodanese-related sulfurtransferase